MDLSNKNVLSDTLDKSSILNTLKSSSAKKILSIQSHVVHGYAGNKCSVFPLQLFGFEVDFINSVQFSNHTGYKNGITGYRLTNENLKSLYSGLKSNNLNFYSYILSGYCGDASFLRQISVIVRDVKQNNPKLIYVCDPVLGDNDRYYVPEELRPIYCNEILPIADVITPNVFELSALTGITINNENDCLHAIKQLHKANVNLWIVVVTSGISDSDNLSYCYSCEKIKNTADSFNIVRYEIPIIKGHYVGTGDLFSSLLLIWLEKFNGHVQQSICKVISSLQSVLQQTYNSAYTNLKDGEADAASNELKIIQARYDLLDPPIEIKYKKL